MLKKPEIRAGPYEPLGSNAGFTYLYLKNHKKIHDRKTLSMAGHAIHKQMQILHQKFSSGDECH